VVAGDGSGDHLLDRRAGVAPPAWDPARLHTLAYYSGGAIVLRDADTGTVVWRAPIANKPVALSWSSDGSLLAAVSQRRVVVLGGDGTVRRTITTLTDTFRDASFRPGAHDLALSIRQRSSSEISLVHVDRPGTARVLFAGPGAFGDIVWAPSGGWLLVDWPTANQWVFLRGARVRAVSNIEQQFPRSDRAGAMLQIGDRWCCVG
jgi:outer membrane protein assembly factor BamB